MGLKQILGWAASPFELTLTLDADTIACPGGLAQILGLVVAAA